MDSEKLFILGHRGFRGELENTIPAFRRALRYADGVEFDVRMTADGKLVVHHDEGFRSGGRTYRLRNLTLAELRRLHPLGKMIPTVDGVVRSFPSAVFDVDVKEAETSEGVVRTLERAGAVERAIFSADSPEIILSLLRECPDCRVGFSIVGYSSIPWIPRLKGLHSLHVPIDAVSYIGYNAVVSLMRVLRKRGLRIYLWNYEMDELSWVPRFLPFVDAVISDDPARLRKVFYGEREGHYGDLHGRQDLGARSQGVLSQIP